MIHRLLVLVLCLFYSSLLAAAPVSGKAPMPLLAQVQSLSELLSDGYATWYPEATMVQFVKPRDGEELALVVFTVESFGGGNNQTQYLAAFRLGTDENGKQHFSLMDVMRIAGKAWRAVSKLNAKVRPGANGSELLIAIDALNWSAGDAANSPSKKATIHLLLKDGRFAEQKMQP